MAGKVITDEATVIGTMEIVQTAIGIGGKGTKGAEGNHRHHPLYRRMTAKPLAITCNRIEVVNSTLPIDLILFITLVI